MTNTRHKLKQQPDGSTFVNMSGLTLVEMLIAMALSVIVMGGIVSLYVSVGESATYLNAASRVQENGRFALDHITRTVRMAGYDDPNETTDTGKPTNVLEGKAGSAVSMSGFTVLSDTDAVLISHEGATNVKDCQGVPFENSIYWVTNTYAISSNGELLCDTTASVSPQDSSNPQIIAEGIENMEIIYGVDSDADGVANRYYTAANVSDWTSVVSAKITLLVNSVESVYGSSLHACESCDTFNPTANDLMRAEFHSTIQFRN